MCRDITDALSLAWKEGDGYYPTVVQDVSGGGKYATMVVEVEGVRFNVAVSQITKARGQKTSYV